jgi:anti-sigma regulatory factor (Ser/Thr protein kinase)
MGLCKMVQIKIPAFIFFFITICSNLAKAQQRPMAGVAGPGGFMFLDAEESFQKRNILIDSSNTIRLFDKPTIFGDVDVFFFKKANDTLRRSFLSFFGQNTPDNSFRKINDSVYEIHIRDPAKMVLFGQGKMKKGFGFGMKLDGRGGLNAANLMGEGIDSLLVKAGSSIKTYKVRSFNPFLDGLELYVFNKKTNVRVLIVQLKFQFPAPKLSGISTDTAIIWKKKNNPSYEWNRSKQGIAKQDKKITLKKSNNSILLSFEHFSNSRFSYLDNLQYKFDQATDWAFTPLAHSPCILLENLSPGKHKLSVKYPGEAAEVFTYEIEVESSFWDSPVWYMVGGIILSGFIFFLLYRRRLYKAREKANRTRLELQAIQAQLNPHFIFNALGSIQYLMNKNDKKNADHYLTELAKLLRHSLNNSEKELIPLSVEINMLDSYIRLEQMRFNFKYKLVVEEGLQNESLSVPPMLVQPLIENAIKHGISGKTNSGILVIIIKTVRDDLEIIITDTGSGFDRLQSVSGLGIKLVENRIKLLKQQHHEIELHYGSDKELGTVVTVRFKNWL